MFGYVFFKIFYFEFFFCFKKRIGAHYSSLDTDLRYLIV